MNGYERIKRSAKYKFGISLYLNLNLGVDKNNSMYCGVKFNDFIKSEFRERKAQ